MSVQKLAAVPIAVGIYFLISKNLSQGLCEDLRLALKELCSWEALKLLSTAASLVQGRRPVLLCTAVGFCVGVTVLFYEKFLVFVK